MSSKVLIIDDEKDICFLISEILQDEDFTTETSLNSTDAINKLNSFNPDLIILDVWLNNSKLDGIELLKEFKKIKPSLPIIIISGHGTVDMAVNSIKNGAYDFLEKPFNSEKLLILTKRAIESAKLINENELLKKIANSSIPLIGKSTFIINLNKNLNKISSSKSRVLITGPKGSGKRLIAKNIHKCSLWSKKLANIIDFKNTKENELIEMFQHDEKNLSQNLFVKSNNTTLILNNIEYLPVSFQKILLIYLENDKFFENYKINLNIKLIAITSKNIEGEISKGNFMRNLYDRLNVISINIPTFKERKKDIIPICEYYLNYFNINKDYKFLLSDKSSKKLEIYQWPGDIRQLVNYIEKTIILNQDLNSQNDFTLVDLPVDMGEFEEDDNKDIDYVLTLKEARLKFEKKYFLSQIERFNGNITKISEFTGMERTALYRKFKSLKISLNK